MSKAGIQQTTAVFDPLRQGVALPLAAVFHPLGFTVEVATNSSDVLLAARESWDGYSRAFEDPPIRIQIAVDEKSAARCPSTLTMRAQRHLMTMISDPANFAVMDMASGFAFCWFSPATARNRAWLRYWYLDTVAYLILWHLHLARIHASCVALGDCGVLLCGPSGAGKSCLAYACVRDGWTFISDDATSILRRSRDRTVLGKPQAIRLRDSAADILPDLEGLEAAPDQVGKMTIEVPMAEAPGVKRAFQCRAEAIVFLNRDPGGPTGLVPLSREEAWRRLEPDIALFEAAVYEEHKAAIRDLLDAGAYELRSYDLAFGVRSLRALLEKGEMK